ncbi:hypothetical protein CMV_013056 [Castanea mollissima]|uniref:CBS domain-containing protein n=1 Tax=Castanea mollissima TaxID=60419 RepID=A0A8J4RE55_9ROSI|nr:hypothetical protein CMV_013056 [Castanea mollissima]
MKRGHDSSGISVPVLIPCTFLWRNGGRSVALCGTFTRWSGSIPMSLVEGRDDVFQVVCNLTPGNHQYKFCVDGVWRHDESQPFITGDYGLVNTILIREPDMIPPTYSHQPPDMDMDYDVVMPPEAVPRISVTDLEVSRHRISLFLSTHNAYELLPESGKIIALDVNLPVKQAFHILYEQGISVAPLWDFCKGQFVGVLSALDFILILKELGSHGSNLTEEELETHTIAAWKEGGKLHLTRTMDGNGASFSRRHLVHGSSQRTQGATEVDAAAVGDSPHIQGGAKNIGKQNTGILIRDVSSSYASVVVGHWKNTTGRGVEEKKKSALGGVKIVSESSCNFIKKSVLGQREQAGEKLVSDPSCAYRDSCKASTLG